MSKKEKTYWLRFTLSFGNMKAELNRLGEIIKLSFDKGEDFLWFQDDIIEITEDELSGKIETSNLSRIPQMVKSTMNELVSQLKLYEQRKLKKFDLQIMLEGTEFQHRVWNILLEIPYGETVTYGAIAKRLCVELKKNKMSAQAVGGAVGRNPVAILVPCHRVVGADGSLTGYAGGLDKKEALLECEGVI